nr:hypothetical protein [Tanacetum cinerariifolium]
GGYLLAGYSGWYGPASPDPDDVPYRYWLLNTTAAGVLQSQQVLSGNKDNVVAGLVQQGTALWVAGSSASDVGGDRTAANRGSSDFWVVKYDATTLAVTADAEHESGLALFPNPVSTGKLTIVLAGIKTQPAAQVQLINKLGQVLKKESLIFSVASTEYELSISDLPPGVYTLLLQASSGTLSKQFVKE